MAHYLMAAKVKKSPFVFEIQNICCEVCTDLVKRNYCHFDKVAPNKYALSFLIEINRQLPAATEVAFTIDVRPKGGQKAVKFVNLRLKVCDALASLKTNPMLMMILREMLQNSNLPLSCPLKPNILYNISNMMVSDEIVPSYAPTLDFNFTMIFYLEKSNMGTIFVQGAIKRN
ncbi:uncharacterized protein LOC105261921 [Musca domestica]|uniref:Uncharacterized protein LOC105261921 n=1 Tax=Musca domestica TaxID=7370 RepID=A0A9J7D6H1_MUSDO|nr:uncharacterized protein LOC105261921 [Musca domestica]